MPTDKEKEWVGLENYIQNLLDEGKRSGHQDFQVLFRIYGKQKIVDIAKNYLEKKRGETNV